MEPNKKSITLPSIIIFSIFLTPFLSHPIPVSASSQIPAVFAFGDSMLDPGNNDQIPSGFKADHLPYGRDLPLRAASGRFTNGKLLMDMVVSNMGLKNLLPAYLDPTITKQDLLTGVSFASAGTGFDDMTATISNVLTMSKQIHNFQQALRQIQNTVGVSGANQIVDNALFAIGAGVYDMLWSYYDIPTRRGQYNVPSYQDFLVGKLEATVQQLYNLGARRFSIAGLPPMGCLPVQVSTARVVPNTNTEEQNLDSQAYNAKLQAAIPNMRSTLPGSKIAYLDMYNPLIDIINNPVRYGFTEATRGCCGTQGIEMGSHCNGNVTTCPDATKFVFWDAVHPTQATYGILANSYTTNVLPQLI